VNRFLLPDGGDEFASVLPISLWAVGTHMHYVGTDMKISVENSEGDDQCLIHTPGAAVVIRIGAGGRPTVARGPTGVTAITHAAVADDGAVWLRTLGPGEPDRDRVVIVRDGAPLTLASPAGAPLRAESLALDDRLGVVVLAAGGAVRWLLAERPPSGQPVVLQREDPFPEK
jgi:hypothetical protein